MLNLARFPLRAALAASVLAGMEALGAGAAHAIDDALALQWIAAAAPADAAAKVDEAGDRLVHVQRAGGHDELWAVALDGGAATRLAGGTSGGGRIAAFQLSPDGRRVAFSVARGTDPRRLYVVDVDGGLPQRVDDDGPGAGEIGEFAFAPDSQAVAYLRRPAGDDDERTKLGLQLATKTHVVGHLFSDGFEGGDSSGWSDTTASSCPTPTGGPTLHANAVANGEVWTANGSPHVLTGNVDVGALSGPAVTLTIQPCAEVRLAAGVTLTVNATGSLIARGTPLQRITFQRNVAGSPFNKISVRRPGALDLAFADIIGGDAGAVDGVLDVQGSTGALAIVDHVKVIGSAGYGVRFSSGALFHAASRDLVISGSGATVGRPPFPLRFEGVPGVGGIPSGSYTGNASDRIQLIVLAQLQSDVTFHDRGTPYQIGGGGSFGRLEVGGGASMATLTLEPGVEIRFFTASASNFGGLFIGTNADVSTASGRLIAAGTAARPIVLTAADVTPAAGAWEGVTFRGVLAADNLLDHVRIEAAGSHSGSQGFGCPPDHPGNPTDGALKIFQQPQAQFLFNSTISSSSSHGVFRAWTGSAVDFMPSNTFVAIALCQQVEPKPPAPASCPLNPECPT